MTLCPFSPPTLLPSLDALAPTDIVVVGVSKTKEGPLLLGTAFPAEVHQALTEALAQIEADGAKDSTWRVPPPSGLMATSVVFVGLGEAPSDTESLRAAGRLCGPERHLTHEVGLHSPPRR